jgi:hypothetical protein
MSALIFFAAGPPQALWTSTYSLLIIGWMLVTSPSSASPSVRKRTRGGARPDGGNAARAARPMQPLIDGMLGRVGMVRQLHDGEKQLDHERVRNVDKERAHNRHDEEGQVRGPVALCYRGHVGHCGGRCAEGEANKAA